jgi:hypothetical protein
MSAALTVMVEDDDGDITKERVKKVLWVDVDSNMNS